MKKTTIHDDGSQEVWDDEPNLYFHWDSSLELVETRPLTNEEKNELNPGALINALQQTVDQLVIDSLMGG